MEEAKIETTETIPEETAIEVQSATPSQNLKDAIALWNAFLQFKKELLTKDDVITINNHPYILKSGWRKFACAFSISTDIINVERIQDEKIIYKVIAKATHKNRTTTAVGIATSTEVFAKGKGESALLGMAQTRAVNRAIADIIGGEVSAEEMMNVENGNDDNVKSLQNQAMKLFKKLGWDQQQRKEFAQKLNLTQPFIELTEKQLAILIQHLKQEVEKT